MGAGVTSTVGRPETTGMGRSLFPEDGGLGQEGSPLPRGRGGDGGGGGPALGCGAGERPRYRGDGWRSGGGAGGGVSQGSRPGSPDATGMGDFGKVRAGVSRWRRRVSPPPRGWAFWGGCWRGFPRAGGGLAGGSPRDLGDGRGSGRRRNRAGRSLRYHGGGGGGSRASVSPRHRDNGKSRHGGTTGTDIPRPGDGGWRPGVPGSGGAGGGDGHRRRVPMVVMTVMAK